MNAICSSNRWEGSIFLPAIHPFDTRIVKQATGLLAKVFKVFSDCLSKLICCRRKQEPIVSNLPQPLSRIEQLHHLDALLSSSAPDDLIKAALFKLPVGDRNDIFHYIWIAHGGKQLGKNILDKQNKFGENFFRASPCHPSVKAAVTELIKFGVR